MQYSLNSALRVLIVLALALPGALLAQNYPTKPIRLIVGYTPGGGVDINARLLASKLPEYLGQAVIVENRPGAGTNIANEYVAKSAPDGYTLLMAAPAILINMSLYKQLPFDTLRDYTGVSLFSTSPNILVVGAAVPAKDLRQLLALARSRPGEFNYSTSGNGSTQHLSGALLRARTGIDMVHVPYKGSAPALAAVIGGDVQLSFANIPAIRQHVASGRLRPLASTSAKRSELMPEVPTMRESGVDIDISTWYGVAAPAATPRAIVDKLAAAIAKVAQSADMRQRLIDMGAEPISNTPDEYNRMLRAEISVWAEAVKSSGAKADE